MDQGFHGTLFVKCRLVSWVKIVGDAFVCAGGTAVYNVPVVGNCKGKVAFTTGGNNLIQRLTDTSVSIVFNSAGKQVVYARLPGSCRTLIDSLIVDVQQGGKTLDLGSDKELCPGNAFVLNAHKGYLSYRWQDGSIDSVYSVTKPGLYYVMVTDACGGTYSDTVVVTQAQPISFNIGPDRTKCNTDTLRLSAPSGFLNYTWSTNYNISSLTGQNVVVYPIVDTAYYIKAEKTPGCFAYDTVRITVHHSPPIDLGADKSFCLGDSAMFDAGAGFQTFLWSNGSTMQQVIAKAVGTYSIVGTTTEGCKSSDTVKVLNAYPLPVVSLNKNPALCFGESRSLTAGNFSSYQWNTGATSATITVSDIGNYRVRVMDANGCKGIDSTAIMIIHPLPAGFLPLDTAICSYGTIELKANIAYSKYLWSTGGTSSTIVVTKPGQYWLDVVDANTCKGRDTVAVNPKDCLSGFYMPTAFTPNGDGRNDRFQPLLFGPVKAYRFTVYNRWGQIIFQTTDLQTGWDGKVGGIPQRSDVFVWTCTYQLEGESQKAEKGSVTLIR